MNIQLSRVQFFMLLFTIYTGFVYISMQTPIISHGKRASWLLFIVTSIIIYFLFILYEKTYKYFVLGTVTTIIYHLYWLFHLAYVVAYTAFIVSSWISPYTPKMVLLLLFLIPCLYASLSRAETAVNIGVVLGVFIIFFMFFVLTAYDDFRIRNLLPTAESGLKEWVWGMVFSFNSYRNMECYLILRKYVMKNEKIAGKPLFFFMLFLFFMYFFSIVMTMLYFSIDEFKLISEPLLYLLHAQEVTFAKRLDLIFVLMWILITIITLINFILVIKLVHFKKKRRFPKTQIVVYHVLIFLIAFFIAKFDYIQNIREHYWVVFFVFGFLLPVVIIIWNKLRGRTIFDSSESSS